MIAPSGTIRAWVNDRVASIFHRHYGIRMMTGTLSLMFDAVSDRVLDSVRAPFLRRDAGPAYDSLTLLGSEQSMPQYPGETNWLTYRDRLRTCWDAWSRAGSPGLISEQLALSGLPGAQIFRWSRSGVWSEFVVFFPKNTHTATGSGPLVGSFIVGDGSVVGISGLTPAQLGTYSGLINHWKPARWICDRVIFELTGWTVGSGHDINEPGLVVGGTVSTLEI